MDKSRQYWADWLRSLVVLSLSIYHTALTFTALGPMSIYLQFLIIIAHSYVIIVLFHELVERRLWNKMKGLKHR